MFTLSDLESTGEGLLKRTTQPVTRFRLLRDVLGCPTEDRDLIAAHAALMESRWVQELTQSQHADGTWGRFHSRDSALKLHFPTTELALYRARALGLSGADTLIQKSMHFMEDMLMGKTDWSDPKEKHEGWAINTRFITAGTLASLDPFNPFLPPLADHWTRVVNATFAGGSYDSQAERQVHLEVNGIHTSGKYLKLAALYPLLLLNTHTVRLEEKVESSFLRWVCEKPDGIYYVYGGCLLDPPDFSDPHFQNWLDAIALVCRFYGGRALCAEALNWLWQQRSIENLWDFGSYARRQLYFPLSESWQNPLDRQIDCSIPILSLLRAFLLEK